MPRAAVGRIEHHQRLLVDPHTESFGLARLLNEIDTADLLDVATVPAQFTCNSSKGEAAAVVGACDDASASECEAMMVSWDREGFGNRDLGQTSPLGRRVDANRPVGIGTGCWSCRAGCGAVSRALDHNGELRA